MVIIASVIRQILHGIDGFHRIACHLVHRPIDSRHSADLAAIVLDGLDRPLGGKARGDGGHQHQHMLAPDHGLNVLPEDDLRIGIVFRLHYIDGLMGVDGAKARFGQLLGNAGAQHRGAVQTQHRIHRHIIDKAGNQLIGTVPSLAETGLLIGDVHIVVDMGMVGHKMSLGNSQRRVAPLHGQFYKLDHGAFLRYLWVKKKKRFAPASAFSPGFQNAFFHYNLKKEKSQVHSA